MATWLIRLNVVRVKNTSDSNSSDRKRFPAPSELFLRQINVRTSPTEPNRSPFLLPETPGKLRNKMGDWREPGSACLPLVLVEFSARPTLLLSGPFSLLNLFPTFLFELFLMKHDVKHVTSKVMHLILSLTIFRTQLEPLSCSGVWVVWQNTHTHTHTGVYIYIIFPFVSVVLLNCCDTLFRVVQHEKCLPRLGGRKGAKKGLLRIVWMFVGQARGALSVCEANN